MLGVQSSREGKLWWSGWGGGAGRGGDTMCTKAKLSVVETRADGAD